MIYSYGVSSIGPYHIKNNLVCQDAHYIKRVSDNCTIAASADGLGSEKYSDIASKLAVKTAVEFCADKFDQSKPVAETLELMRQAFLVAQTAIESAAQKNGHEITDYDTTLDLVVLSAGNLYYGHVGDSGVIVQTADGRYLQITEQDRDEYNRVFPLCYYDHWKFGAVPDRVASVMLCTDGIWGLVFPKLLSLQENKLYVALARFFMDRNQLGFKENGMENVQMAMEDFIKSLDESQVDDDRTVVVLCDDSVEVVPQPDDYYRVPDWGKLRLEYDEAFKRAAYPHLYADSEHTGSDAPASSDASDNSVGEAKQTPSD